MLVLSALCILLPLVAALEPCDETKTKAFLAMGQLEGNLLDSVGEKTFWVVALSSQKSRPSRSIEYDYGSANGNTVPLQVVYRESTGAIFDTQDVTITLDEDHFTTGKNSAYTFKCSTNLIVGYRCQEEGTSGGCGPKYLIWAAMDTYESDICAELESCIAKIVEVDSAATFVRRIHP